MATQSDLSARTREVTPRLGRAYLRVLASGVRPGRPRPSPDEELPADITGCLRPEAGHVEAYRKVCGLREEGAKLPPLYPQVLTFPLHLELLGDPLMPASPLGMIHLAQAVRMRGELSVNERLTARVGLEQAGRHRRGGVLRLVTRVESGNGEWIGESLILFPGLHLPEALPILQPPDMPEGMDREISEIALDGSTARRYARVSGDWNPIHLGQFPARLMGQRRPMAHGMWSLARLLGEAGGPPWPHGSERMEAWFTSPLFYPGVGQILGNPEGTGLCLRSPRRNRTILWSRFDAQPATPDAWVHTISPESGASV